MLVVVRVAAAVIVAVRVAKLSIVVRTMVGLVPHIPAPLAARVACLPRALARALTAATNVS